MKWTVRVLTGSALMVGLAVLVANGQAAKPSTGQQSPEVSLQQRVGALEKEVQSLKGELAALRAQIQQTGSTKTPAVSGCNDDFIPVSALPPSQASIQTCVNATSREVGSGGLAGYGRILSLEFGTPTISQGGMMEMAMGATKGTTMFPTKIQFDGYQFTTWIFEDSFGTLKCVRAQ